MKKEYDLEKRTFRFAIDVASMIKYLPKNDISSVYSNQLIRSSSAVGANYIEANEALSKKDFLKYARISRKECRESTYWLKLLGDLNNSDQKILPLIQESIELKLILSSIIEKTMKNMNIKSWKLN